MGSPIYSADAHVTRSASRASHSVDDIFEQNKKKEIHDSMNPKKIRLRESRDSENHPNSFPVILGLDETGSMGEVPEYLVKEGLPRIMAETIEQGVPDPQILFLGIGDSKYDNCPLQVGQFESSDVELDMWLTRVYLEGRGGGNGGESYHWAWYFAAQHTATDSWDKRKQKGLIITVGDEPCHKELSAREISEVMGYPVERSFKTSELLEMARERYNVYHIHMTHGGHNEISTSWKNLLGENCIAVNSRIKVSQVVTDIIVKSYKYKTKYVNDLEEVANAIPEVEKPGKIML